MEVYEIKNAVESIKLPEEAKKRILDRSLACAANNEQEENPRRKRINLRRTVAAAIAAVMLLSITAYASNGQLECKRDGREVQRTAHGRVLPVRIGLCAPYDGEL